MIIIILVLAILVVIYLIIVTLIHETKLPSLNLNNFFNKSKNILFVFPHPDDETMMSGGLIYYLSRNKKFNTFAISVTAGEHGIEKLDLDPGVLAKIRKDEFQKSLNLLKLNNREVWNFVDGRIADQIDLVSKSLQEFIRTKSIDTVVTYEKMGAYGHPDHIAVSSVVNSLASEMHLKTLYTTLPDKLLKRVNLPKTLTYKDRVISLNPGLISDPEYKVNITSSLLKKYLAARKYKSQRLSSNMPLFLMIFFGNFEYYTTKY